MDTNKRPTITADGEEKEICLHDNSHTGDSRTLYATGTPGLYFCTMDGAAYHVSKGTVTSGEVHIPAYYRPNASSPYLPVTEIDSFSSTSIVSIEIPAGVTSIGDFAFEYCENLVSINFTAGSQLQTIGYCAFRFCDSLASIDIPAGITSIGFIAFSRCTSLASIDIPAGVTSIGNEAFRYWTATQTINIEGKADRTATIAAGWDSNWDSNCDAVINYLP